MPNYIFWIVAIIVLSVIEAATYALLTIWFIGGAIVALIATMLHLSLAWQISLFVITSVVLLILVRPMAAKNLTTNRERTNADRVVHMHGVVTHEINNQKNEGLVLVGGQTWSAKNASGDAVIAKGANVIIRQIAGVKVLVDEIKE